MRRAYVLMVGPDGVLLLRYVSRAVETLWAGPNGADAPGAVGEVLRRLPPGPLWLLLDVVEEEYLSVTLPAVRRRDRALILQRRLTSAFGNTPLRLAQPDTATRGASALLSAITRPELLAPWLEVLRKTSAVLAGVYSIALLGPALLSQMSVGAGPCVLVSRQRTGGLRQSFLRDGQLVMSRLVPLGAAQAALDAARVATELDRLRQYLDRAGLCASDQPPTVVLVGDEGLHAAPTVDAASHWRCVAPEAVLGARGHGAIDSVDALFAALLCRKPPAAQYAGPEQTGAYRGQRRAQLGLAALSLGLTLAAGGGLWATLDGLQLAARASALATRNGEMRADLITTRAALPPSLLPSEQLQPALALAADVARRRTDPQPALASVEAALATLPALRWTALEWRAATEGMAAVPEETVIHGTVDGLADNDRAALAAIDTLVKALAAQAGVNVVKVMGQGLR